MKDFPHIDHLCAAVEVIQNAGSYLQGYAGNATNVETEPSGSRTCDQDREASRIIYEPLHGKFPHVGHLDEERFKAYVHGEVGHEDGRNKELCWFIDPLDSSSQYIDGKEEDVDWGVEIALMKRLIPYFGVTLKPAKGELTIGVRGYGAFAFDINQGKLWLPENKKDAQEILLGDSDRRIYGSESHEPHIIRSRHRGGQLLDEIIHQIEARHVTFMGGSLRGVEIARGRVNVFIAPPKSISHLWDWAAQVPILAEARRPGSPAHGKITDIYGRPLNWGAVDCKVIEGVVITNGILHNKALRAHTDALSAMKQS